MSKILDYSSVIRVKAIVINSLGVVYRQNHYSVPDHLVGREVEALAFIDEIVVKSGGSEIARHRCSYENHTYHSLLYFNKLPATSQLENKLGSISPIKL